MPPAASTRDIGWPVSIRQKFRRMPAAIERPTPPRSIADPRGKRPIANPARNRWSVKRLRTINKRHIPVSAHQLAVGGRLSIQDHTDMRVRLTPARPGRRDDLLVDPVVAGNGARELIAIDPSRAEHADRLLHRRPDDL